MCKTFYGLFFCPITCAERFPPLDDGTAAALILSIRGRSAKKKPPPPSPPPCHSANVEVTVSSNSSSSSSSSSSAKAKLGLLPHFSYFWLPFPPDTPTSLGKGGKRKNSYVGLFLPPSFLLIAQSCEPPSRDPPSPTHGQGKGRRSPLSSFSPSFPY